MTDEQTEALRAKLLEALRVEMPEFDVSVGALPGPYDVTRVTARPLPLSESQLVCNQLLEVVDPKLVAAQLRKKFMVRVRESFDPHRGWE